MYSTYYKPKLKHLQSIGDDNIPATIYFATPSSEPRALASIS